MIFIGAFVLLQALLIAGRGSSIEQVFVHDLTARPAAALLAFADGPDPPNAYDNRLLGRTQTLTIRTGCDGSETLPLLIAAILALRLPPRRALKFLLAGAAIVLALNQLRVCTLWWAMATNVRLFSIIHDQIAPAILLCTVGLIVIAATRGNASPHQHDLV